MFREVFSNSVLQGPSSGQTASIHTHTHTTDLKWLPQGRPVMIAYSSQAGLFRAMSHKSGHEGQHVKCENKMVSALSKSVSFARWKSEQVLRGHLHMIMVPSGMHA